MNKRIIGVTSIIVIVLITIVVFLYLRNQSQNYIPFSKSQQIFLDIFNKNKEEFNKIASSFNSQYDLEAVEFQEKDRTYPCEQDNFDLCSLNNVATNQATNQNGSNTTIYSDFLKKYKIQTIQKSTLPKGESNIEISSKGFGIWGYKYYPEASKTKLTKDSEYITVIDLGNNWYFFATDWN